jgi:hypothetical protein
MVRAVLRWLRKRRALPEFEPTAAGVSPVPSMQQVFSRVVVQGLLHLAAQLEIARNPEEDRSMWS